MARKTYSEEFRRDGVELYRSTAGATVAGIAADLGIMDTTLSSWLKAAGVVLRTRTGAERSGPPPGAAQATAQAATKARPTTSASVSASPSASASTSGSVSPSPSSTAGTTVGAGQRWQAKAHPLHPSFASSADDPSLLTVAAAQGPGTVTLSVPTRARAPVTAAAVTTARGRACATPGPSTART